MLLHTLCWLYNTCCIHGRVHTRCCMYTHWCVVHLSIWYNYPPPSFQDPVCTPDGHLYSKEAIVENLLEQKKAIKRQMAAYEAQLASEQQKVSCLWCAWYHMCVGLQVFIQNCPRTYTLSPAWLSSLHTPPAHTGSRTCSSRRGSKAPCL